MTTSGIAPATCRFVAQPLNHYATARRRQGRNTYGKNLTRFWHETARRKDQAWSQVRKCSTKIRDAAFIVSENFCPTQRNIFAFPCGCFIFFSISKHHSIHFFLSLTVLHTLCKGEHSEWALEIKYIGKDFMWKSCSCKSS
jgi:hypothetical protein